MKQELLSMNQKEITRLELIQRVKNSQMSQLEASARLGVSTRQLRRLQRKYEQKGTAGLISQRRGKASNNQLSVEMKGQAFELIKTHYSDFVPRLACEKLFERHQIKMSSESVRQLMLKEGLWASKKRKKVVVHQTRARRSKFGELLQIDGSPHDWFEGRSPACCLLVFIDDATSRLVQLYLIQTKTPSYAMKGASVTIIEQQDKVILVYKGQSLSYKTMDKHNRPAKISDSKQILIRKKYTPKPSANHPWRRPLSA